MKKVILSLFFSLTLVISFAQGKLIIWSVRHGGDSLATEVCKMMVAEGVTYPAVENMSLGMMANATGTDIADSDSLIVQKRMLVKIKTDTASAVTKRYLSIKKDVISFYESFDMFPTDTSSQRFIKTVNKIVSVDYCGRGNFIDGYTNESDSLVREFFDLKNSLAGLEPEYRAYAIERMLLIYERFNQIRENEMIRIIKLRVDNGEVVGYPVGAFHTEGLVNLAKQNNVHVVVKDLFDPNSMNESERFVLEVTNFSLLTKKRKGEIIQRFDEFWKPATEIKK